MKIVELDNKRNWEEFIASHSPQSLFQSWNWGEAIRKVQSPKPSTRAQAEGSKVQSFWRLGVYENDNLVGIAQIVKVVAKRGTFLHIRHGPIFSSWKKEYFSFLLNYLKVISRKENSSFVRISPLLENSQERRKFFRELGFIDAPIHRMDGEMCWVLDLDLNEENLFANMRKTTRYLIRQAKKMGVEVVKSTDKEDLEDFLSLYIQTAARHHFVPHKGIAEEFSEFLKDDQTLLFKGYFQDQLLVAALVIYYNHQAFYHHSASVESKIPVSYFLIWEAILEAKKRGKKVYNFWGIAPEENIRHPWRGLTLFKKGFGGRRIEYLHAQDLPLSAKYCTTYIIEWLRRVWKGY